MQPTKEINIEVTEKRDYNKRILRERVLTLFLVYLFLPIYYFLVAIIVLVYQLHYFYLVLFYF